MNTRVRVDELKEMKGRRERRYISLQQASRETGIAYANLWKINTVGANPTLFTLLLLAKYFDVSLDTLIERN